MADGSGRILLNEVECAKWQNIAADLRKTGAVAGLFHGWIPDGYEASTARVLYVGKATARAFDKENDDYHSFNGGGHFWSFARQLARAFDLPAQPLTCIAWTNIAKVSRPSVAADKTVIKTYENVAIETLRNEISQANPDVVVFVSAHFSDQVVRAIAEGESNLDWIKSEDETTGIVSDVWWKHRVDGLPVVWMPHPQRVRMALRDFAARKIVQLKMGRR